MMLERNECRAEANRHAKKAEWRERVEGWFLNRGYHGGTADEAYQHFLSIYPGIPVNSIAPRVSELYDHGRGVLVRTANRRPTASGGDAYVYLHRIYAERPRPAHQIPMFTTGRTAA